jgi:quercetin dioxygenase-like cupin family protein
MLDRITHQGGRDRLFFLATNIQVLVSADDSQDAICVVEHRVSFGDSPPLHIHRNEDETFVILEGRVQFQVGDDAFILAAGAAAVAPKGIAHSYRVDSAEGARFLTITRGRDFETMLKAVGEPTSTTDLPPGVTVTPEMAAGLAAICAANAIDLVGPPLA